MSQIQKLGPDSGGGVGNVIGPASSTDNAIVRWDGITGKLIQDSNTILDDNDNVFWIAGNVYNRTDTAIDYTVLTTDYYIGVTDTSVPRTVSLPAAPLGEGQVFLVKDESGGAGTNSITIDVDGAATTIDGSASYTIDANYGGVYIFYDGTEYRVINSTVTVAATDSTDNVAAGLRASGSGSTKTIELTNRYRGTLQSTDATPTDVITIPLGATAGVYIVDVDVVAFNTTDSEGAGYNLFGTVRTDGTDSTLCGTPDKVVNEEGGMTSADSNIIAGGVADNNLYIRVTGIAAKTIEWNAVARYSFVSA